MDSSSCDNNYQSIAKQCLDLTKACVNNDQVVKLSLSIGTSFSFNFCSEHNAKPLPAVLPKKNKSPGTRARDLKRRAAFLHKKAAASTLPVALDFPPPDSHEVEPSQNQPNLPPPSLERRHGIKWWGQLRPLHRPQQQLQQQPPLRVSVSPVQMSRLQTPHSNNRSTVSAHDKNQENT